MKHLTKRLLKTGVSSLAGGALGAGTYGLIGGIGLAVAGTAISITMTPLILLGSGVGASAYGLFWLGSVFTSKKTERTVDRRN